VTSHAVSGLPFGLLTISPDVYCAAVEGAVVIRVVCRVVFAVLELPVHAVINTHAMMRNSSPVIILAVLFMVLTESGEYFKKSFYPLNYITTFHVTILSQQPGASLC
jgi:hypothetical protein